MRMTRMFAPRQIDSTRTDFAPRTVGRQRRATFGRRNLANAGFLRRRERLFGMTGHYAAAWSAGVVDLTARGGKSVAPIATDLRRAMHSSGSRRHSGMNPAFFQLSIVVIGKPVSRAISAEPPSASII